MNITIVPLNGDLQTLSQNEEFSLYDLEHSLNDTIKAVSNDNVSIYKK